MQSFNMPDQPNTSSAHRSNPDTMPMSELEYGLIVAYNAFRRWMIHCMGATGVKDFNPLDILVLHNVNHRERHKRLSDIAFVLNIDDRHTVNYALKKLLKARLISNEKRGKEMFYCTTRSGAELCARYREIRDQCLVNPTLSNSRDLETLHQTAKILRNISGQYDQASRVAASS
ncbi:MAG: winged helix DNA-binding protein [Alphaproteobacteria bacterium]|nr:winged helix DNA-binding protein [Alphaproteobacteria bacterium]